MTGQLKVKVVRTWIPSWPE